MRNLNDYVPKVAALIQRTNCSPELSPSDAAKKAFAELLTGFGYRLDNPEVFDAICTYGAAEREKKNIKGLFLKGATGIGKTLGVEMLAAIFHWPIVPALKLEEMFTAGDKEFDEIVSARDFFGRPVTLVIDDVGTETFPLVHYGSTYNLIANVLDTRYREFSASGVRTIVTCNLNDDQIRQRYGERIDDRLGEMFRFEAVRGRSLR